MTPYYSEDGIVIYHGDARDIVASVDVEALITDPVWPNCEHVFPEIDAPELLRTVLAATTARRVVVQIGCASDVRFLGAVPPRFAYLRTCWMEYACPSYQGRILNTGDVAYVFGEPPLPRKGAMLLPGKVTATRTTADDWRAIRDRKAIRANKERTKRYAQASGHPTPRRYEHMAWLVKWFGGQSVLDPFIGSGTTLLAAKRAGIRAVGIDINERFCEMAATRLAQRVLPFEIGA